MPLIRSGDSANLYLRAFAIYDSSLLVIIVVALRAVSHHSGLVVVVHLLLLAHGSGEVGKRFLTLEPRILNDA